MLRANINTTESPIKPSISSIGLNTTKYTPDKFCLK